MLDKLEPGVSVCETFEEATQASIAISLKRIADALHGVTDYNRNEPFGAAIRTQPGETR